MPVLRALQNVFLVLECVSLLLAIAWHTPKQQLKFPSILFALDAFCAFAVLGQGNVMGLELAPYTFVSYAHGSKDSTDLIYTPHNVFLGG